MASKEDPMTKQDALPTPAAAEKQWAPVRDPDQGMGDLARRFGLVIALLLLAVSMGVAYYSANAIVSVWFEYQYVPIVRLVLALLVAATTVWVIVRLTRRGRGASG